MTKTDSLSGEFWLESEILLMRPNASKNQQCGKSRIFLSIYEFLISYDVLDTTHRNVFRGPPYPYLRNNPLKNFPRFLVKVQNLCLTLQLFANRAHLKIQPWPELKTFSIYHCSFKLARRQEMRFYNAIGKLGQWSMTCRELKTFTLTHPFPS